MLVDGIRTYCLWTFRLARTLRLLVKAKYRLRLVGITRGVYRFMVPSFWLLLCSWLMVTGDAGFIYLFLIALFGVRITAL